jgi:hypothetical protein
MIFLLISDMKCKSHSRNKLSVKKRGSPIFLGNCGIQKRKIQVNKYTTDTGTLWYAFFENIDFNVIICTNVTKDVLK